MEKLLEIYKDFSNKRYIGKPSKGILLILWIFRPYFPLMSTRLSNCATPPISFWA